MGKRGRKPTPTIVLRNRGSWRGSARKNEPVLPVQAPEPPEFKSPLAREKWGQLLPILVEAGILTQADGDKLACYCEVWAEYRELEEYCRKNGKIVPMVKTDKGNLVQNPAYGLRNTLRSQLRQLGADLGLSPADRANIKAAPKPKEEDAKKRFFKGAS